MKTLLEIFSEELDKEKDIIKNQTENKMKKQEMKIGQTVLVSIIKNGHFLTSTTGQITGFSKNGRITVQTIHGKKTVSPNNVTAKNTAL